MPTDMHDTDEMDIQRRIGGLQALVSSNRDGIQEVKQSIKDLQASSVETQKLVISNGENVRNAVDKLILLDASLVRLKTDTETKEVSIEKRVENLERLQAKITGGLVVLVCLLNAPWEWLLKMLRVGHQ